MKEVVLDASVVVKWFAEKRERGSKAAKALREEYVGGQLWIVVPSLLYLELINVSGRRWLWNENKLISLATALENLGFYVADPTLASVASWTGQGLTAYDAAYVGIAEERGIPLITDDRKIVALAPEIAKPLQS